MPFREVTTVIHTGRIRPDERFSVVLTTRVVLVFSVTYDRNHHKRFRLEYSSWPKPVRDAAAELAKSLRRRGRPIHEADCEALIKGDEALNIGEQVKLTVTYGRQTTLTREATLRGTVTRFVLDE